MSTSRLKCLPADLYSKTPILAHVGLRTSTNKKRGSGTRPPKKERSRQRVAFNLLGSPRCRRETEYRLTPRKTNTAMNCVLPMASTGRLARVDQRNVSSYPRFFPMNGSALVPSPETSVLFQEKRFTVVTDEENTKIKEKLAEYEAIARKRYGAGKIR